MIEWGVIETRDKILAGELTCSEVVASYLKEIERVNGEINAVIEVFDDVKQNAALMDEKIKAGFRGKLAGVPIIIKDNILLKGKHSSAGSKMLKDYVAEYTSTVAQKLIDAGAVIVGRANMDEFAMGSGTETSVYGATHNPLDPSRVAGGSSGGSAASVCANLSAAALGTDTGGSIRQPSAYCGVVGMKPTYGRVSRYGVIAFASSLDQVGPITKNVADNALLLEVLSGQDERDETSSKQPVTDYSTALGQDIRGMRIGVVRQVEDMLTGLDSETNYRQLKSMLAKAGAQIVNLDIANMDLTLPVYYIIAPAEATSNLARYDGVKYTYRSPEADSINSIYHLSRTEGFGEEVKRRIMLGNYVLSSGYFDAYYNKARSLQAELRKEFLAAFEQCDLIIMPTTRGEAFKLGSKSNPLDAYKEDMFTVSINIVGVPALSLPFGVGKSGLPIGMQIVAPHFEEKRIYRLADFIEKNKEKC